MTFMAMMSISKLLTTTVRGLKGETFSTLLQRLKKINKSNNYQKILCAMLKHSGMIRFVWACIFASVCVLPSVIVSDDIIKLLCPSDHNCGAVPVLPDKLWYKNSIKKLDTPLQQTLPHKPKHKLMISLSPLGWMLNLVFSLNLEAHMCITEVPSPCWYMWFKNTEMQTVIAIYTQ